MLQIDEIFGVTIQGEGKRIGNPSIFIRSGRCNMKCSGFKVGYKTPSGIKNMVVIVFMLVIVHLKSNGIDMRQANL